jgi:rhodanese-related sulfurtransferase
MKYETVNVNEATIIDVREPFECEQGMIVGAINIPLGDVPHKIEAFKAMKKPLVLCCKSGGRSGQAVQFLAANGVADLYNGGSWGDVKAKMIS